MEDMPPTYWNGSWAKMGNVHTASALWQGVIVDVPMSFNPSISC